MNWLWFLAGSVVGMALGLTVVCCIVINRDYKNEEDLNEK